MSKKQKKKNKKKKTPQKINKSFWKIEFFYFSCLPEENIRYSKNLKASSFLKL